jgi:hypothetical protein
MSDPRAAFIEAATWHGSLERAEAILKAHDWHDYEGAKYLPCSGLRVGDTIPSR